MGTHILSYLGVVVLILSICLGLPTENPLEDVETGEIKTYRYVCSGKLSKLTDKDCEDFGNITGCYFLEIYANYYSCAKICNDVAIGTQDDNRCRDRCLSYLQEANCLPTAPTTTEDPAVIKHRKMVSSVVGGVVGGTIVLLILFIIFVIYLWKRRLNNYCWFRGCERENPCCMCLLLDRRCPCGICKLDESTPEQEQALRRRNNNPDGNHQPQDEE